MRRADLKKYYVYRKSIFTIAKTNKVCFDKNYFINLKKLLSFLFEVSTLTLPVPIPDNDKKLSHIFICTLLCGASKGFMNALKLFVKI